MNEELFIKEQAKQTKLAKNRRVSRVVSNIDLTWKPSL
jgi:hypothetical protein